jgi:hypothetical protein
MLMLIRPTRRLRFVWLALFAVLLNALAPTVSHALAASRPAIPVDVCSVDGGAPFAAAAALLMQEDHGAMGLAGDCGYCLAHAGSHGLPPPVQSLVVGGGGVGGGPLLCPRSAPSPGRSCSTMHPPPWPSGSPPCRAGHPSLPDLLFRCIAPIVHFSQVKSC